MTTRSAHCYTKDCRAMCLMTVSSGALFKVRMEANGWRMLTVDGKLHWFCKACVSDMRSGGDVAMEMIAKIKAAYHDKKLDDELFVIAVREILELDEAKP